MLSQYPVEDYSQEEKKQILAKEGPMVDSKTQQESTENICLVEELDEHLQTFHKF